LFTIANTNSSHLTQVQASSISSYCLIMDFYYLSLFFFEVNSFRDVFCCLHNVCSLRSSGFCGICGGYIDWVMQWVTRSNTANYVQ